MRLVEMIFSINDCPRSSSATLTLHCINVMCLSYVNVEISRDVSDLDIVCVIGQGRPSRPMMCRRSRSAALRMFATTIVAIKMLLRPRVRFSKAIYMISKQIYYDIDTIFFRVEYLPASPIFKLSLWQFLKIILAWFDPKVGIFLSKIYRLSTSYKPIAQHTAQKLETLTVVKLTHKS